jgi:hypothetical protein
MPFQMHTVITVPVEQDDDARICRNRPRETPQAHEEFAKEILLPSERVYPVCAPDQRSRQHRMKESRHRRFLDKEFDVVNGHPQLIL